MSTPIDLVLSIVQTDSRGLLQEWLSELQTHGSGADHRISESELQEQGAELLRLLVPAIGSGTDISRDGWRPVRDFLENVSRSRALQGFTSSETAMFVFSLKRPLFGRIRARATDPATLGDATW